MHILGHFFPLTAHVHAYARANATGQPSLALFTPRPPSWRLEYLFHLTPSRHRRFTSRMHRVLPPRLQYSRTFLRMRPRSIPHLPPRCARESAHYVQGAFTRRFVGRTNIPFKVNNAMQLDFFWRREVCPDAMSYARAVHKSQRTCLHACLHTCHANVCTCVYANTCMHACLCMYACLRACLCTCLHACTLLPGSSDGHPYNRACTHVYTLVSAKKNVKASAHMPTRMPLRLSSRMSLQRGLVSSARCGIPACRTHTYPHACLYSTTS